MAPTLTRRPAIRRTIRMAAAAAATPDREANASKVAGVARRPAAVRHRCSRSRSRCLRLWQVADRDGREEQLRPLPRRPAITIGASVRADVQHELAGAEAVAS